MLQEVEEAIARAKAGTDLARTTMQTPSPVPEDVDSDDDDDDVTGIGADGGDQLMTVRTGSDSAEQIKSFLYSFLYL